MKRSSILTTLAVFALTVSGAVVPAHAEALKSGFLCGFTTVTDPTGQANTQTGEIEGGPVVIVDDTDPTKVWNGDMTCTIQVGSANSTHAGADAASVTGPVTPFVVSVPPSQVTYTATPDDNVYLCTEIWIWDGWGHIGWYYDDPNDPTVDGTWSTSNTANCGLAISAATPGPEDCANDPVCSTIDLVICTFHQVVGGLTGGGIPGVLEFDSEGDATLLGTPFWDCPPYGS